MANCEIYFHTDSDGLPQARIDGSVPLRGRARVCFFINGYNVDARDAKLAFDDLVRSTRREAQAQEGVIPQLDGNEAWRIYVPAYARLGLARWTLSFLSYPWHVADVDAWAGAIARLLVKELASQDGLPVEVTFVAHSLGCRVTLELIRAKLMNRHVNWRVQLIFLMAAAVPVHLVEFDNRLCRAALQPTASFVAFSIVDPVLMGAFRVGQMPEGGFLPSAIGTGGQPAVLWTQRVRTWNLHSGYFTDPRTARHLAVALGLRAPREPDRRDVAHLSMGTRSVAEIPPPAKRSIPKRRIGG